MPSDAAKRRKEERAAKRAAKGFTVSKPKPGCECCDDVGHPAEATPSSGPSSADAAVSAAAEEVTVRFPPSLTSRQRAVLHAVAERHGVPHSSSGDGEARRITLGRGAEVVDVDAVGTDAATTDEAICELLETHLRLSRDDSRRAFDAPPPATKTAQGTAEPKRGTAPAVKGADVTVEAFVNRTRALLELERAAEVEQSEAVLKGMRPETAQRKGRALLGLRCVDLRGGLLGKTVVTLELASRKAAEAPPLPPHKLSPHDVVCVRPGKGDTSGEPLCEGVVYRVRDTAVEIAVDDLPDGSLEGNLRVERLANETSHRRLVQALDRVGRAPSSAGDPGGNVGVGARLVDVMFGNVPPRFHPATLNPNPNPNSSWVNPGLDPSQIDAVAWALAAADVALIHGPPGTGKTTAVVEYVQQEIARGARVLCCAASNVAVDNLVERLMRQRRGDETSKPGSGAPRAKIVRIGHPARLLESVLDASLEAQVLKSDNSALARDCEKECRELRRVLLKLDPRKDRAERNDARRELRRLAKEEKARQRKAVDEVIGGSNVICATLSGALSNSLRDQSFDVVVIDEAAQALEAACWGAILKGRKVVLAGDHLQLPPTVMSDEAAKKGLSETLFARVHAKWHGIGVARMLTTQYRMNRNIMQWASDELYEGKLVAADSVAEHRLEGAGTGTTPVLILVDTAGCDMEEHCEEEGDSTDNPGEAAAVMALVRRLIKSGAAQPEDIGVITPYSAQVGVLRDLRAADDNLAKLEISTVDGFQGREKEAIIISAVRSNEQGEVGFLSDARRMNVAVTRARRHCCLVCDTETVGRRDAFMQRLVEHFEQHGEYISAAELEDET